MGGIVFGDFSEGRVGGRYLFVFSFSAGNWCASFKAGGAGFLDCWEGAVLLCSHCFWILLFSRSVFCLCLKKAGQPFVGCFVVG